MPRIRPDSSECAVEGFLYIDRFKLVLWVEIDPPNRSHGQTHCADQNNRSRRQRSFNNRRRLAASSLLLMWLEACAGWASVAISNHRRAPCRRVLRRHQTRAHPPWQITLSPAFWALSHRSPRNQRSHDSRPCGGLFFRGQRRLASASPFRLARTLGFAGTALQRCNKVSAFGVNRAATMRLSRAPTPATVTMTACGTLVRRRKHEPSCVTSTSGTATAATVRQLQPVLLSSFCGRPSSARQVRLVRTLDSQRSKCRTTSCNGPTRGDPFP
jgi:hypothetical protein